MAILNIRIVLSAYYPEQSQKPRLEEVIATLGVNTSPYTPYQASGAAGLVIGNVGIREFEDFAEERYEEFGKAVEQTLLSFAKWLTAIPIKNMRRLQASGMKVYALVTLLMDQDQMEFTLPPVLASQFGRLGLEFYMVSNE